MTSDIQQQIDALRDRIGALLRENDRLEAEPSTAGLEDGEQKIRANRDIIASLASQMMALDKQRRG